MTSVDHAVNIATEELPRVLLRAIGAAQHGSTIADAAQPDLPLVYVNQSFTDMTGYEADEVLGRNCRFLQGPDTDPAVVRSIRAAIQEGRDSRTVLLNHRKDGTPFHNELTISTVRDDAGQITHLIGVQIDVTDQVELQRELTEQATTDSLTGLGNRKRVTDTLQSWQSAATDADGAVVVYLDIENFQRVNEAYDYEVGNRLLIHVGRRLSELAAPGDVVARLDADTFVLARRVPRADTAAVAGDLIEQVTEAVSEPLRLFGRRIPAAVTCSTATWPTDGDPAAAILEAAHHNLRTTRVAARSAVR
ncbi:diguanylate cyclase [Nakamurella flavida]|uniref:Diguanylate cyclase n=1 Tax=Nakamurella flavida TaxID=363630 RepID=A0A938YKK1_9ACTN|nr:diguanylate cyclase [Nakamurella flavida]MBM9474994.1 diguanylate cyclase [Nakamurella flavida]MDP9776563.1 PAS domain S-box-containing protein/diguanylate cyclase (GGDEF)-like protein [Nakamurella flavida]